MTTTDNSNNAKKPSIFVCKNCKQNEVQVEKQPRKPKEQSDEIVVKLEPSKQKDTKYTVKINNGKKVSFGQKQASDFTIHKSQDRRNLYIARHEKREKQFWDFDNPENLETASFWSRYLLWGDKSDILEAIKEIEEKAKCKIVYTQNTILRHQRKLARLAKQYQEDEH